LQILSVYWLGVIIFQFQLWKSAQKKNSLIIGEEHDEAHWGWSWLERWMAARPWETAYLDDEEQHRDGSYTEAEVENQAASAHDWRMFPESPKRDISPYQNIERAINSQTQNQSVFDTRVEFCATMAEAESFLQPQQPAQSGLQKIQAVSSPITTPKRTYAVIKQSKNSPSRANGTQVHALDITSEAITSNKHMVKGYSPEELKAPNKHMLVRGSSAEELKVPKAQHERVASKPGLNRRSFSGPLKSMFGNTLYGSPVVPSYMAATQSAKAKVRSQSNPKTRPDAAADEKATSPALARKRSSLPLEGKPNPTPCRTFRSSSTKGLSFTRGVSREGGA
jgi:hypothetical protein